MDCRALATTVEYCGLSIVIGVVLAVTRRQEIIYDKASYFASQPLSGGEVGPKMDAGEDSAERGLFVGRRKAIERALYSRHNFRGNAEVEMIVAEERYQ